MQTEIENLGAYQIHLFAREAEAGPGWDAYLTVMHFDLVRQDFVCVLEKFAVPGGPFSSDTAAIEAARVAANTLLEQNHPDAPGRMKKQDG